MALQLISNLKMIPVFIILIVLNGVTSEDYCHFVAPNKIYSGLRVYQKFSGETSEYLMYNRVGVQRVFTLESFGEEFSELKLSEESLTPDIDTELVAKYGVLSNQMNRNCVITRMENKTLTQCDYLHLNYGTNGTDIDNGTVYRNPVFLTHDPLGHQSVFVFNPLNRSDFFFYALNKMQATDCSVPLVSCHMPKLLKVMNDNLFQRLDAAIPVKLGSKFPPKERYMFLFNIDNRPKICFTSAAAVNLSSECNSTDLLKPIFSECFQIEDSNLTWLWITVGTVTTILAIILIVVIIIVCRKRKKWVRKPGIPFPTVSSDTTTDTTYQTSVSSFNISKSTVKGK